MEWRDVGQVVAKAAPLVGFVVGGPVGAIAGAAGALVASVLGCEATPDAVSAALAGNPEAAVKLREIESAERVRLLEWQADQLRAELENVKDARAREVAMAQAGAGFAAWGPPAVIAAVVAVGFFVMLWVALSLPGDKPMGETLAMLLGSLGAAFGAVVNYYLGSSLGSAQKTAMIQGGAK